MKDYVGLICGAVVALFVLVWFELRRRVAGTCWRCMHHKSQHIRYRDKGIVVCSAEEGCDCQYSI